MGAADALAAGAAIGVGATTGSGVVVPCAKATPEPPSQSATIHPSARRRMPDMYQGAKGACDGHVVRAYRGVRFHGRSCRNRRGIVGADFEI